MNMLYKYQQLCIAALMLPSCISWEWSPVSINKDATPISKETKVVMLPVWCNITQVSREHLEVISARIAEKVRIAFTCADVTITSGESLREVGAMLTNMMRKEDWYASNMVVPLEWVSTTRKTLLTQANEHSKDGILLLTIGALDVGECISGFRKYRFIVGLYDLSKEQTHSIYYFLITVAESDITSAEVEQNIIKCLIELREALEQAKLMPHNKG
jgi:hypothetical protein